MLKFIKTRISASEREGGFALALVLSISLVLMLLVVTVTSASVSGLRTTRTDQDSSAALSAAYAGVDEYESRLAGDSSYGQYGNPKSKFTIATNSSVIAPPVAQPNTAFDVTQGGTWTSVPGSSGNSKFRYEVDNSHFSSNGVLRLRSTGLSGGVTRSVVATVKGKGFIDFLYFTNYEIADPSLTLDANGNPTCTAAYGWQVTTRTGCTELAFNGGDTLDGPVHSNDVMHICTTNFTDTVTSADPTAPYYSPTTGAQYYSGGNTSSACTGQNWATIGGKKSIPTLDSTYVLPQTNTTQLNETRIDDPQDVPRPGCLYTGPTKITLTSDGNMKVWSPFTKYTQSGPKGTPAAGVVLQSCGTPGASGLGAVGGQVVAVPNNNIVYVQNVPSDSTDPNYTAVGSSPNTAFAGCYGSNTATKAVTSGTTQTEARIAGNGIGFPTSKALSTTTLGVTTTKTWNEKPPSSTSYGCYNGDAFVQGQLHGRLTISAANYVYITDDTTYADTDGDILGIVGQKAIWVWSPILNTASTFVNAPSDLEIDAALLSLADTFTVQNYTLGPARGKLTIMGAIAQNFRGAVATSSGSTIVSGYKKDYHYDEQMKTSAPPKFLAPVSTTYGTTSVAQVAAGYLPDGTAVSVVN